MYASGCTPLDGCRPRAAAASTCGALRMSVRPGHNGHPDNTTSPRPAGSPLMARGVLRSFEWGIVRLHLGMAGFPAGRRCRRARSNSGALSSRGRLPADKATQDCLQALRATGADRPRAAVRPADGPGRRGRATAVAQGGSTPPSRPRLGLSRPSRRNDRAPGSPEGSAAGSSSFPGPHVAARGRTSGPPQPCRSLSTAMRPPTAAARHPRRARPHGRACRGRLSLDERDGFLQQGAARTAVLHRGVLEPHRHATEEDEILRG